MKKQLNVKKTKRLLKQKKCKYVDKNCLLEEKIKKVTIKNVACVVHWWSGVLFPHGWRREERSARIF